MRPPSFGNRGIQPPGKSSSIRPPRSGQSAPTNQSLRPSRRPSATWVCLLVIALVAVAGAVVHLRGSAGSHAASDRRSAEDDAAQPSSSDSASSSIPATGTPMSNTTSSTAASPVTDDPWVEQWRLETGMATAWKPGGDWGFLSNGNHIAVYDKNLKGPTPIQIYRIVDGRPTRTLDLPSPGYIPWGINSTSLFYARGYIDLETGETTEDVWGKEFPTFISDDLIITCSDSRITCSAWDMSNGALSLRWSQKYPGSKARLWQNQRVGDTNSGYLKLQIDNTIHFISLSDGSSHNPQDSKEFPTFIAASDGWIRIDRITQATTLSPDGARTGSFSMPSPFSSRYSPLLITGSGSPTVGELRRAYESQDTSWAQTSVSCASGTPCTLNGEPLSAPTDGNCTSSGLDIGDIQNNWVMSPDNRFVIVKHQAAYDQSTACIIDVTKNRTYERQNAIVPRGDLIIAVEGTTLVGYSPTQQE